MAELIQARFNGDLGFVIPFLCERVLNARTRADYYMLVGMCHGILLAEVGMEPFWTAYLNEIITDCFDVVVLENLPI